MRFVDTNVLLYAVSRAPEERSKTEAALGLLDSHDVALSVRVLQEFYVQATLPTRSDRLTHKQASLLIESWLRFPLILSEDLNDGQDFDGVSVQNSFVSRKPRRPSRDLR